MSRNSFIALVFLLIWAALPLESNGAQTSATAKQDSLQNALNKSYWGEGCVEAFGLATRQLPNDVENRADLIATAEAFRTLANIARVGGDVGTSIVYSEAGLILATELWGNESLELGSYELIHALALRLSGRPNSQAMAFELVEGALHRYRSDDSRDRQTLADLQQARANFTRAKGDLVQAIIFYETAIATRLQGSSVHSYSIVDNEVWLAHAVLNSGDYSRARTIFEHCRQDLLDLGLGEHHLMASTTASLARISYFEGDVKTASVLYRQAYAQLKKARNSIFPGFSQRRLESPLINKITYLEIEQGDYENAWLPFSEAHANDGHQISALKNAREFQPDLANAVHLAVTNAATMISELEAALRVLRLEKSDKQLNTRSLAVIKKYAHAMSKTYSLRNKLRLLYRNSQRQPASLPLVQSRLKADQAFLGYFIAYDADISSSNVPALAIYAVVVRKSGPAIWTKIQPPKKEIADRNQSIVMAYSDLISKASEWPTRLPEDPKVVGLLKDLYGIYFAPVSDQLGDCNEIFILSSEISRAISFPALIEESGQPLLEKYVFQDVMGVDGIGGMKSEKHTDQGTSLVLGDPAYTKNSNLENTVDPSLQMALSTYSYTVLPRSLVDGVLKEGESSLARLPRLNNSGWEARGIASMTSPVVLLTGDAATEQELYKYCGGSQPQTFKWIHLATHALVHMSIPERSALALSPDDGQGLLFVEEIGFGWALNCQLITLSGCQTGRGLASWNSGQLGFIQALQTAGAQNLLLSTAKVDDIATALLMERFYANISNRSSPRVDPAEEAPLTYSFALAEAQRWIRDLKNDSGQRPFEHPVYWANFKLFGSNPR